MKKKLLFLILIILSVTIEVNSHREAYLTRYHTEYWQEVYEKSNWAKGWEASKGMGDADLYAYAGWRQVKGDDPVLINAEMPPLGKYLLGFSILFFQNQNIISLVIGMLLLAVTFFIAKEILKDLSWSLLPVLLLSMDKLFKENLSISMLDLPFTLFIALAFYCLMKGRKNQKWYFLMALCLAAVMATKMYLVGMALTLIFWFYLLILLIIFKFKDFFWFTISLPLLGGAYFGFYLVYFLNGHSLLDFKYLHFWIRYFARVQVSNYPQFEILRIFLLGKWKTWWGGSGIVDVSTWSPLWTLSSISLIFVLVKEFKRNLNLVILGIWVASLLIMFSYGVPYPRYLLPILPATYIFLVYSFKSVLESKVCRNIKL